MIALGPAIGFLMGSLFESEWININDNNIIIKNNSFWIGRWWMGFIISSSLLLILSFILFTYPSYLNNQQSIQSSNSTNIKGFHF